MTTAGIAGSVESTILEAQTWSPGWSTVKHLGRSAIDAQRSVISAWKKSANSVESVHGEELDSNTGSTIGLGESAELLHISQKPGKKTLTHVAYTKFGEWDQKKVEEYSKEEVTLQIMVGWNC